jgi:hypothetical protein
MKVDWEFFKVASDEYRKVLMPPACRFEPTCSVYAAEAIETQGLYGLWLAVKRILKCHPFHPGGFDPVPPGKDSGGGERSQN